MFLFSIVKAKVYCTRKHFLFCQFLWGWVFILYSLDDRKLSLYI
jgi:hypothetical protein